MLELPENKMSPDQLNANSNEEESSPKPSSLVDEDSADVEAKKPNKGEKNYRSPIN